MDAIRLYDACATAVTAARARHPRTWRWRTALWLTGPTVTVGDSTWQARAARDTGDGAAYGFTGRQLTQVERALRPALAAYGDQLERAVRRFS